MREKLEMDARQYAGIPPDVKNVESLRFSKRLQEVVAYEKYVAFIKGANSALKSMEINSWELFTPAQLIAEY